MPDRRVFIKDGVSLLLAAAVPAIAAAPLRMAFLDTYVPISYFDGQQMRGILIDLLDEAIEQRMRLPITHGGYPWAPAQRMVELGTADALCATPTPARLEYAEASQESVLRLPFRVFVRADNPLLPQLEKVRKLDELRLLKPSVISYNGNSWAKQTLTNFSVNWAIDFDASLRMLIGGRGDIIVESAVTARHWLKNHEGTQDIRMLPQAMDEVVFHLLINKQSPHVSLLPAFDVTMRKFKLDAAYAKILERYGI